MAAPYPPVSMPKFVARCLEEVGLEGRCGIPLRDMLALVDPVDDAVFRRYAWRVLRSMRGHLRFHRMERTATLLAPAESCGAERLSTARSRQQPVRQRVGSSDTGAGRRETQATEMARRSAQQPAASPARVSREQQQNEESSSPMSSPPRRKRKWSTTLMASPSGSADEVEKEQWAAEQLQRMGKTHSSKKSRQKLEPVVPSARRKALKKQRRPLIKKEAANSLEGGAEVAAVQDEIGGSSSSDDAGGDGGGGSSGDSDVEMVHVEAPPVQQQESAEQQSRTSVLPAKLRSSDVVQDPESVEWIYQSPRGYVLGDEVDVSSWSYEDAMAMELADSVSVGSSCVLGIVACEQLRLKYLGVTDSTSVDTLSPQFDLLEMIGRAREQGENAAVLTNSNVFGDSRKLHYLLDMLIASNLIEKNMVTADHRRFNILHLTRFVSKFHPSMVSPSATMERAAFPKEFIAYVIAEMLAARGERTCVFADIGRELGYDKRYQEKLRKFFFHQMHVHREFPLEMFMARCNTGSSEYRGRKLWCIRLRHALAARGGGTATDNSAGQFEPIDPPAVATTGPVIERGIMEQVYSSIERRKEAGATIPEIRDLLGVPTFKLPYRLAQGLISKYNLVVEQVVVGKSTMYRMFIPGANAVLVAGSEDDESRATAASAVKRVELSNSDDRAKSSSAATIASMTASSQQPSTMRAAAQRVLVSSTSERRRNFMLERIQKDKIVPVHQLRTLLMTMERDPGLGGSDLGVIDIRSVRRILDELENAKSVVTIDITLPPKRVLQKSDRVIKCVCLPGYQRDREAITKFVDAYIEEQQQRFMSDIGQPENTDVVVVSSRGRGRKTAMVQSDATTEFVTYAATSYKTARVNMVKLSKQNRRLGMIFGSLYRCRAVHLLLWEKIELLRHKSRALGGEAQEETSRIVENEQQQQQSANSSSGAVGEVVFALHEVLELMSVKEYLQFAGVSELLTETEENKVRMAMVRGDSWGILPSEIQKKIRGCEVDRFSRTMRILIELGLVKVVNDSSSGLLNAFRSDDFDAMVSQVAFATLSGGLFRIKERARIIVKRGDKVLKQLPTKQSYVYAASFSGKSRSDHFAGKVPLEFMIRNAEDAKEYWKALRFLSLESARLGSGVADSESMSVHLDSEVIRPVALKDHNIYSLRVWMPHGMTNPVSAKTKAAEAAAEPMKILKRKRFQNTPASTAGARKKQKTPARANGTAAASRGLNRRLGSRVVPSTDAVQAGVSKFRRLVSNKQSVRASKWTLDDDMKLMDAYIDELSCKWFIEIPLALQKSDERLAFRNTSLERTRISWKNLAEVVGKRFFDCFLRVNELLNAPAVRARVENTKLSITQMKNPGGSFHEELAVMKQPRLAALLNRALQILFHDRASYYPVLADLLISRWSESEVKLVWRYLWLAGLITRTRKPNDGDQKERGFTIHSRVHEMKSLNIAHFTMAVFCEAAEYASFIQENVKEVTMLESGGGGGGEEADGEAEGEYFEYELEPNASAAQTAVELSSMILSSSELYPEYVEPSPNRHHAADSEEAKRAMAVKGFAGHLATCCAGAAPDDFLKEYWTVKARVQTVLLDDAKQDAVTMAERAKTVEAFSTFATLQDEYDMDFDVNEAGGGEEEQQKLVSSLVHGALGDAASDGLSFQEVCDAVKEKQDLDAASSDDKGSSATTTKVARLLVERIRREVDLLVSQGRVIEVNGYAHARFVLKEHSEIWTLHPYRVSTTSSASSRSGSSESSSNGSSPREKVHFWFDKQQTIVPRPWFLLDGTRNTRVELVLKRKVVNIVLCTPGIQDHVLHRKMRKLLSLQNLRALLDELIADDIVHARLVRGAAQKPASIFSAKAWKRPRSDDRALAAVAPGDLRFVDASCDEIHYFPAVNCMELLGAAACDADVRATDQ